MDQDERKALSRRRMVGGIGISVHPASSDEQLRGLERKWFKGQAAPMKSPTRSLGASSLLTTRDAESAFYRDRHVHASGRARTSLSPTAEPFTLRTSPKPRLAER
jgi:hypothetical protein